MALDPRMMQQPPLEEELPPEEMVEEELPPEEAGQEPAMPQAVGDEEMGITQASPEEQAQADQLVTKALEMIYSDDVFEGVVQMLEGGASEGSEGDPGRGLAEATDMIVARVGQMAGDAGVELMPDVVHAAFGDILEELAEISRRGKIKDYSKDPDALESAYFQGLDLYRDRLSKAGVIDQEHAKGDFAKLQQMDQNGQLERVMRDLAANDRAGQAGGKEPPPQAEKKPKGFNAAMGI